MNSVSEQFEELPALFPADFFALSFDLLYSKKTPSGKKSFLLPDTSSLLGEESFAKVFLAWNEKGIFIEAEIDKLFEECFFPEYSEGDSLELFFDTRDLKTTGFATRFCHHFLILPRAIDGVQSQEITHFRTEDRHPLCDPSELEVEVKFGRNDYKLEIFIPSSCLQGYDPLSFDRLGFTYRINRYQGPPQHFSVSSQFYSIQQQPSLWSSLKFTKE